MSQRRPGRNVIWTWLKWTRRRTSTSKMPVTIRRVQHLLQRKLCGSADFDVAGIVRRINEANFTVPNFDPPPVSDAGYAGF